MQFSSLQSDRAVLAEIGERISATRLERNRSQSELARAAGISKSTLERLESGQSASLVNLVRILRELGLVEQLEQLLPEPAPSPVARLKLQGKQRKRASRS